MACRQTLRGCTPPCPDVGCKLHYIWLLPCNKTWESGLDIAVDIPPGQTANLVVAAQGGVGAFTPPASVGVAIQAGGDAYVVDGRFKTRCGGAVHCALFSQANSGAAWHLVEEFIMHPEIENHVEIIPIDPDASGVGLLTPPTIALGSNVAVAVRPANPLDSIVKAKVSVGVEFVA